MDKKVEAKYPFHPRTGDQLAARTKPGRVAYVYSDEIVLAVNAALATKRPLLLRGAPGSGKSTLAKDVALALSRTYSERVITSHTTATDLLWQFDAVERLSDVATPELVKDKSRYVRRSLLWDAFDPDPATDRGAVVLIDEIDKADPDVPNDLLAPLGEDKFLVTDARPSMEVIRKREVLVLITTNGERELPPAFLRRCVALTLEDPSKNPEALVEIAQRHLDAMPRDKGSAAPRADRKLLQTIVERIGSLMSELAPSTRRPGTGEILDAFKASLRLGITPDSDDWNTLTRVLLWKDPGPNPDTSKKKPT